MATPAVSMRGITRRFGPVLANDDVSLELAQGEIHALVGENGAGKTTLMRVLYGMIEPDRGSIEVGGHPVRIQHPADAMRLGLGMVHQHFMLVDPLTVAENVTLGHEPPHPLGAFDRARAELEVSAIADGYRLSVDPGARVDTLPVGAQQRVEIVKALRRGARVLILDEPTAVLTPQEVDELFGVLRTLRDQGVTIVLITHKLAEVKALAHRVTVMRAGRIVGGGTADSLSIERIAEMMMGRPVATALTRAPRPPGEAALEARELWVRDARGLDAVRGVSFHVASGEIVGIAGVEGNGQHELVECIAGLLPAARGEVRICGARPAAGVRAHLAAGLAHIPSDRLRRGLVPDMTLAENLILGFQHDRSLGPGPLLDRKRLAERARRLLAEFDVRPAEPGARAGQLSGGNQQKLIAARELSRGARAILAAHPTRGVDLGAIAFLHRRLLAEREAGRAVLLVSSELGEILALSDRILVLFQGKIAHETRPEATDERTLGLYMTGRSGAAA